LIGVVYYSLSPEARVRREGFGLLFYNSSTTNLTFVKSGNLLDFNEESRCICGAKVNLNAEEEEKIKRILQVLLKKGLIVDADCDLEITTAKRVAWR